MKLSAQQAEWRQRLLDSGFHDIEAPSGIISSRLDHQQPEVAAHLECARLFLHGHVFRNPWEHEVWSLHCDDVSNREISRRLGVNRKNIDEAITRLTAQMQDEARPRRRRPGRPRDPESMRSEGLKRLVVRMTPEVELAVEHMQQVLKVSRAEAVRISLLTVGNELRAAHKQGASARR